MSIAVKSNPINLGTKIDQGIAYLEKNIINSRPMKFIKHTQTVVTMNRLFHALTLQVDKVVNGNNPSAIARFFKEEPVTVGLGAARFLTVFNILGNATNLVKSIKSGIESKKKIQKMDASLKAAKAATSLVGNAENIAKGLTAVSKAIKVAEVVNHVFGGFNIAGSALGLVLTGREIYQTEKCYRKFTQIRSTDYKALNKFLTDDANIRTLGIEKSKEFKQIVNKMVDNTKVLNAEEQEKVDSLVKDLKGRLKTKQATHTISVLSDCFNIVTTALAIASIAFPPLLIISLAFGLGTLIGTLVHKQITNYQFEQKMGMIESCPKELSDVQACAWKVRHFFQWNTKNMFS